MSAAVAPDPCSPARLVIRTVTVRSGTPTGRATSLEFDNAANSTAYIANIADVLIESSTIQYHETVGNAAGDLAAKFLAIEGRKSRKRS